MKRIKIMLITMAIFAVVGGAFAFKAKSTWDYCTALTIGVGQCPNICPNLVLNSYSCLIGTEYCYTPTANPDLCDRDQPVCHQSPTSFCIN